MVCSDPVQTMVYIDDYNAIEKINVINAESHITTDKMKLRVLARKSEAIFEGVQSLARSINMCVNTKKNADALHLCTETQHGDQLY